MNHPDPLYSALLQTPQTAADHALAVRYAPIIRFDAHEPFLPLAAGYTIVRAEGSSPSFPRQLRLAPGDQPAAALAIEYAVWWDWDIGHLYELEHVWVYVDGDGKVVHCEASWHGGYHSMVVEGQFAHEGDHVIVYSEPGKHAFAPAVDWYAERRKPHRRATTRENAGAGGLLVTDLFKGVITARTPLANTLVRTYLQRQAFTPAWDFNKTFRFDPAQLVPWPALNEWIPRRMVWWVEQMAATIAPADYRFLRVGHRGASAHAPDNTLAGIRKAAELGADMVEIDVQLTADGEVVAVHDAAVRDESGRFWPVNDSTLDQLQALDVGGGERVPTLDAVIACCKEERIGLYIELKDGRTIAQTLALLRAHGRAESTIIGSFRPDWLAEVKALSPYSATSVLFGSTHVDPVKLAQAVGADYVHPCWERRTARPDALLTPEWMARVRAAGLGVVCWHEERPEVIAGLRTCGVDAICTDRPELLLVEDPPPAAPGRHILAICFDFGDTLVDEATEVKDETTTTQHAELIPGAAEVVRSLWHRGYRLALIADGRPGTYVNVLKQHGLYSCFDAFAISDHLGVEKPDRRMFAYALERLGVAPQEYGRTIMVGNYLARDIKGANDAGMISVWLDWSPRRPKVPADATEQPHYRITQPRELLALVNELERSAQTPARL